MISLLPSFHETIVTPQPAEVIYESLKRATSNKPFLQPNEKDLKFNGWVTEGRFRISLRQPRVNYYLTLVVGQIEATSSGSILIVDYTLFPTTRLLLTLWTIILVLGSVIFSFQSKNMLVLLGGTALILLIHAIVWSNFNLQLKPARAALHRVLTADT